MKIIITLIVGVIFTTTLSLYLRSSHTSYSALPTTQQNSTSTTNLITPTNTLTLETTSVTKPTKPTSTKTSSLTTEPPAEIKIAENTTVGAQPKKTAVATSIAQSEITPIVVSEPEEKPLSSKSTWWKPQPGLTWQWQLSGKLNTTYDVDVYDIDLFETSTKTIADLQSRGIKVICYFSAGSYEDWRPDSNEFSQAVLGKKLDGWAGEKWLDISRYEDFSSIMLNRLDLAAQKGCDAVEPDNIDGYQNKSGFLLTDTDQLKYNQWLAAAAHDHNLAIGLKNDLDQVEALLPYFDFAINEQCFEYDECNLLKPFIQANKAVFGVEYELPKKSFCSRALTAKYSWLKMNYNLAGEHDACK